jgi:predicted phage terminase large subunit-like protein
MATTGIAASVSPSDDPALFEIQRQFRLEAARIAARDKDVLTWNKIVFPEKFNLPFCHEMHGAFVEDRMEEFTDDEAPRNHAKTAIKCFGIPMFQACEEPKAYKHYLNVQATQTKALGVNTAMKVEFESNVMLRELYGDLIGEKWTDSQFVTSSGVVFTAIGAGQSVRGLNYQHIRPDYIIVDDLYDEEDIENPESTRKKNLWFWGSLYPARARSRRCSIHVQGTAINKDDLLEELKKSPGVKCRTFKAIKSYETKTVLWPELNTFESLLIDQRRMGPIIFAREMQNERRDETKDILKRSYWKFYKQLPSGFDIVVTSWDLTFKETTSGSYVAGLVIGRRGADYFILPMIIHARMDFVETLAAVENLAKAHPYASGHLVEDKANGPAVMSMLKTKLPGLIPILPHGTKAARAVAITPPLAAGNVYLPDESICPLDPETNIPWVVGFIEECANFRGVDGETNDRVDATTQGITYLSQTLYRMLEEDDTETFIEGSENAGGFSE